MPLRTTSRAPGAPPRAAVTAVTVLGALAASSCQPAASGGPPARPGPALRPPPGALLTDLVGGWRWILRTTEAGTTRIETEHWRLRPVLGAPDQLTGRYLRDVEVRSDDRTPFSCNQRPWYRQRALFDVTVEITARGLAVIERGYRTEPSPCDHGFRHLGSYVGAPAADRLQLTWDGGEQLLWRTDAALADLPSAAWDTPGPPTGAWRWDATVYDEAGNLRDEHEWWEFTQRTERKLDATYRRRVVVRSPDGSALPCAGAPSWSFDDAYVLEAQREDEHWRLRELAVDPGAHPCLRATPRRSLDEATAEQLGDYFVLEWRGKRRQVLYRPDDALAPGRTVAPGP